MTDTTLPSPVGAEDIDSIFGHKPGLFLLFFTEMWERFSYYGMRALLTIFLVSEIADGGWGWSREDALKLYGWYTGLVYLTPIFGGLLADRVFGYRIAVLLGALLMTLGHASMALETSDAFYAGLGLLIVGNGLFKPNISSMVGQLYSDDERKKDGAYTIFYMGINAGAFLGILLCGFIGEQVAWSYGFGLAGIFMALGMVMFFLGQSIFGDIGTRGFSAVNKVSETNEKEDHAIGKVGKDRLTVVAVLSFFTIFFWMAFEQAGGSMSIFAKDYTSRVLTDDSALWFFVANALLTIAPLGIVTYVLFKLFGKTFAKIPLSNISIGISFLIVWIIAIWMLASQYQTQESETEIPASWFGILNSFFIIAFAPLFSKIWNSRLNPSAPVKFAIGLVLLGLGFGVLALGSSDIEKGATTASVSVWWLIGAYLLHTLGELCVSPVGLSYVSKLTPTRLVGLMFGIWFGASFVANLLAGFSGSYIDRISEHYGLSTFFLVFTAIPAIAGIIMLLMGGWLKRKMHGID
jgi:POT family proton-dependent oligopeptide transporter